MFVLQVVTAKPVLTSHESSRPNLALLTNFLLKMPASADITGSSSSLMKSLMWSQDILEIKVAVEQVALIVKGTAAELSKTLGLDSPGRVLQEKIEFWFREF